MKDRQGLIDQLVDLAIAEDLGANGDITSDYFISKSAMASARVISKSQEPIVCSGLEVAKLVAKKIDPEIVVDFIRTEGDVINRGEEVLRLSGSCRSILSAERTILNFMQRMSGIATLTKEYVELVQGTKAKILDTRKTTPGFRLLAKQAVLAGGGVNHRMGLYDAVMVKDNHLVEIGDNYLSALQDRINLLKHDFPNIFVELEADNLEQVESFLKLSQVNRILLDNMKLSELTSAVAMNQGRVELEASGGVTLESIRAIAETGVDYISVGALTHSALAVDLSLEIY